MQKIVKFTDDKYICPQKAICKFRSAKKLRTPLYLYGVTGIGKTSLVMHNLNMKRCSYYSASETSADQIKIKEQSAEYTVVLDDLQNLTDTTERESYFEVICKLLSLNNVWLILIARCPFPRWLLPLRTKYIFAEIEESDFLLSLDEQITYIEQYDIHLTREEHQKAWNLGGGNALSLLFFAMEKGNLELTQRRQWDYLETHVYDQWDLELQEFFMDMSIVETFTVRLASMLTGRSDVEKLIFRAEEVGNFFDIRGTDGIWKCRWPMRKSMQQRLRRKRSIEQINHLYYVAGLYYELEEKPLEALSMYEKYNDMESISRLLISNARKNPSSGHFYELRKYYLKLPEELISGSPVLMAGISLLQSMLMNIEESNRWYHQLEKFAEEHSGSMKKEALSRLLYLKIALPHTGTANMIDLLKNADLLIHNKKAVLPELSVTSNLPSMMNGGKDFCEWSKRDTELALTIGKSVEFVLEKYGKIDALVNNAGINLPRLLVDVKGEKPEYELNEDSFGKMFAVNVKGVFLCAQAVARELVKQGHGVILNMSSESGKEGSQGQSAYSATKGAVDSFTRSWAKELGKYNVRVVACAPGIMEATGLRTTAYNEALAYTRGVKPEDLSTDYSKVIPIGRDGKLDEVGSLVAYLVSDQASYITGTTVNISGGKSRG